MVARFSFNGALVQLREATTRELTNYLTNYLKNFLIMAIKVIAQRREVKLGKNPGMKFVMRPDLYIPIQEKKVFAEASTHSGISAGVIKAAWDAAGEVLRTWATEGHSIPLPGLGTMRFGVRSKAVEKLEDVKTNLITVRRIIFTPNVDLKDELKNTSIQITCLDEEGNVLKRVTSGDSGEVRIMRTAVLRTVRTARMDRALRTSRAVRMARASRIRRVIMR